MKYKLKNIAGFIIIFILVFAWIFSGWPQVWKNPQLPPKIPNAQAAGINLEVPLEMVDLGLTSATGSGTNTFTRTRMFLDPSLYDNATYYFELIAQNTNATTNYNVYLLDVTNNSNIVTYSVPANTANFTRFRSSSFSPTSGKTTYSIKLDQTAVISQLVVQTARIIVQQNGATKTRIQIPLVQRFYDYAGSSTANADATTSTTYTQATSNRYSLWKKNTTVYADLAAGSPWTIEAAMDTATSGGITYAALFNATDNTQVTGTEISVNTTAITLTDADFSNSATNFDEGDNFEARIKTNNASYNAELRGAVRLYVTLTNLSKAEIIYRVGRARAAGTTTDDMVQQRALIDKTLFTNPAIYYEACGYLSGNYNKVWLMDDSTRDSGTGGTKINSSAIAFNSSTKVIVRTAAITSDITSGNRFYGRIDTSTGNLELNHAWVVVQISLPPDLTWIAGSNNFKIYNSSSLTWDSGTLACQGTLDDTNGNTISCTSGAIAASTTYRVQVLLKSAGGAVYMNGSSEYVDHKYVKAGWAGANANIVNNTDCAFYDAESDDGSTTCNVAWNSTNNVRITNTGGGNVVIPYNGTEGFSYLITTDSLPPSTNSTSYYDSSIDSVSEDSSKITITGPTIVSITLTTDGTVAYGTTALDSEKSTIPSGLNDTQTAQNNGNITENFNIKTSNAIGGTQWTVGGSAGNNVYVHSFSINGGSSWEVLDQADTYETLKTSVAQNGTQNFDLKIHTPTSTTDYQQKTITVTVQAVQP